jgi:hypothetical protein
MIWFLVALVILLALYSDKRTLLFAFFGLAYFSIHDSAFFDEWTGQRHTVYNCAHPEQTPDLNILAASGEVWHGGKICNKNLTNCKGCDDFGPAKNFKEIPSR